MGYGNTQAVVGFTTSYDPAGNKLYERQLHAESRSHLYEPFDAEGYPTGGYDSLDRLRQYQRGVLAGTGGDGNLGGGSIATPISLSNTERSRTYDLDGLGNWRRTTAVDIDDESALEIRQHNPLNQITRTTIGATNVNFSYDGASGHSNGNLKNDGVRSYKYDAFNRLVEVRRVDDDAVIAEYVYDALGRRIKKTVSNGGLSGAIPNGSTSCFYSGWRCIEERNASNAPTKQYVWGVYLDELLQQKNVTAHNNFAAGSVLYPLQDLLYRTTALTDAAGVVREAYDTDAYGNTLVFRKSGTPPAEITFDDGDTQVNVPTCDFLFTGQRFDAETQAYYYKTRYYLPQLGRFLERDAASSSVARSLYDYVSNQPSAWLDPSGQIEVKSIDQGPQTIANPSGRSTMVTVWWGLGFYLSDAERRSIGNNQSGTIVYRRNTTYNKFSCKDGSIIETDGSITYHQDAIPINATGDLVTDRERVLNGRGGPLLMQDGTMAAAYSEAMSLQRPCTKGMAKIEYVVKFYSGSVGVGFVEPSAYFGDIPTGNLSANEFTHKPWMNDTPNDWGSKPLSEQTFTLEVQWDYCDGAKVPGFTIKSSIPVAPGPQRANRKSYPGTTLWGPDDKGGWKQVRTPE